MFNVHPMCTISMSLHKIINIVFMILKLYIVHYLMSMNLNYYFLLKKKLICDNHIGSLKYVFASKGTCV